MNLKGKKILAVIMNGKNGIFSADIPFFGKPLELLCGQVDFFWFDDYLTKLEQLQKDIVTQVKNNNYDLVFFTTLRSEFAFETLDKLKALVKTVAWFGDDTWRFESYSSKYAPHYTHTITTDPFSVCKYKAKGVDPILSQWAGLTPTFLSEPNCSNVTYQYDVSFIGQYDRYRDWFLSFLERSGINIARFGFGWPNGPVEFSEMENIFRTSKINLNISNSANQDFRYIISHPLNAFRYFQSPKRREQIKARNFEIPLAGGFQLSNYVIGLEQYLDIGKEVAVYSSPEECAVLIDYFLNNPVKRAKIVENSYNRAIHEHTYFHRLQKVLESVFEN